RFDGTSEALFRAAVGTSVEGSIGRPFWASVRTTITAVAAAVATSAPAAASPVASALSVLRIASLLRYRPGCCRRLDITLDVGLNKFLTRFLLQIAFCSIGRLRSIHRNRGFEPRGLLAQVGHVAVGRDYVGQIVVVLFQLHEVGNVEEGIALQADVDEGRLHAREHPGYAAFVDGSS